MGANEKHDATWSGSGADALLIDLRALADDWADEGDGLGAMARLTDCADDLHKIIARHTPTTRQEPA